MAKTGKKRWVEWMIWFVLVISYAVISFFHEPWFDEAQAWQIGKCASYFDLIFEIPHYEAHPPLWHLILSIPAKAGITYELGLKLISGIIVITSGWIILFCSPFPRLVRYLLPFHYFIFYQYGVVARPYGLMGLLFLLLAIAFEKKERHPWRFTILLALECLTCAYGIVLAGGIAAAWLWEICAEKKWEFWRIDFWKDARIRALFCLLAVAALLIWDISPKSDTVIEFAKIGKQVLPCLIYTLFIALADGTVLTTLKEEGILRYARLGTADYLFGMLIGVILLATLIFFSSKKNLKYFVFPYVAFAVFSAYVYFAVHHVGIVLLFVIFWTWINWNDKTNGWLWSKVSPKLFRDPGEQKKYQTAGLALSGLLMVIPLLWTICASVFEVQFPYFYARGAAAFLKANQLDKLNVLCEWSGSNLGVDEDPFENMNENVMKVAVSLAPYFEGNPFYNFNMGEADQSYVKFMVSSTEKKMETVRKWSERGAPDVIIGKVNLSTYFGKTVDLKDYAIVYKMHPVQFGIWKMIHTENPFVFNEIYLRRDLLEKYHLKELTGFGLE